jgi:hypothetical protein
MKKSQIPSPIERLEARIAPAVFTVTNGNNAGAGSLRQAILDANVDSNSDFIYFALPPDTGIAPTAALPAITQPVTIDGYSQTGSTPNTGATLDNYNGLVIVTLTGKDAPAGVDGLTISGGGVTIRGLSIVGFTTNAGSGGNGIVFSNVAANDNNTVEGCWVGIYTFSGLFPNGNEGSGIRIFAGSTGNHIGGATPAKANLIGDNGSVGVELASDNNFVQGNLIGSLGGGNGSHGVLVSGFSGNKIGGTAPGEGNFIIGNGGTGVRIGTGTGNLIAGNVIRSNAQRGIDLGPVGVTPNDPTDSDSGANNLQNFPVVTSVLTGTAATRVTSSFVTTPSSSVRIEYFSNAAADASGNGQGERFLGAVTTTSDAAGQVNVTTILNVTETVGRFLTATATVANNTSEFSADVPIIEAPAGLVVAANGKSATFTDADGDRVTVKTTAGVLDAGRFTFRGTGFTAMGAQLDYLDLSAAMFTGAKITISAKRSTNGDGFANVRVIDATGVNLAGLTVGGDLAQVFAGTGNPGKAGVGTFSVHSLGLFTTSKPLSVIDGNAPVVKIKTDIDDATFAVTGALGKLTVGGSVRGDVFVSGRIGTVAIAGDLRGDAGSTTLRSSSVIGSVKIGGDLAGARILAFGVVSPSSAAKAVAIKSVTVAGDVVDSRILAGYTIAAPQNAEAQIGAIKVKGNWVRSDAAAGVKTGADGFFGTADDAVIAAGGAITSRIASIVIGGQAYGTFGGTDAFGFAAQQIGALRVGTVVFPLRKTGPDDVLVGPTNDLRAREV